MAEDSKMIKKTASTNPAEWMGQQPRTIGHPSGRHLLADLFGVGANQLISESQLLKLFVQALKLAGCTVISHTSHKFPGEKAGVTGLILLSESHASFHTYPEHEFLAMDIFVCGPVDPTDVLTHIADDLHPQKIVSKIERRGM